ncbi:NADPH-dependent FMN reductase [Rhodococcus sp. H29-C3]|uniref:NADPH-dependent FMN reductase n=1 Tax=Rhodococcus sp. H29-C3 TaxID=3046307 RepID=UPI0024B92670|nr:NADPH-dependent FMN reductase [Rhodococcus sp. H29-C3]MDJ0362332.1 NADPH-dependent FMN reductase [Rhodococcus sp. H29-C3]
MTAEAEQMRIGVIVGSTRPGRVSRSVADWVTKQGNSRGDAVYELIDLGEVDLPFFDEELPPMAGQHKNEHTKNWAETIASYDGFILVSGEYNHSPPSALTNALSFLFAEWTNKAVALVSYGVEGGARAAEHLRCIVGELKMADVRAQVLLRFGRDFAGYTDFDPEADREYELGLLFSDLDDWSKALRPLRVRS